MRLLPVVGFAAGVSLGPPEIRTVSLVGRRRGEGGVSVRVAAGTPPPSEKPEIELEFLGPKPEGSEGKYPVDRARAISGEKLLRSIMSESKIELYGAYGKVMNCGGGGSCGTCIVEILKGKDLLNERTNTELRYLKKIYEFAGTETTKPDMNLYNFNAQNQKKPESWRLACQTIVGNKENSGKVVVQRLPQWKK